MTLGSYLRILRERWKLISVFTVLAIVLAGVVTFLTSNTYTATAQVLVEANVDTSAEQSIQASSYIQLQVATFAETIGSPNVLHSVERDLNLTISDQDLKSKLTASAATAQSIVEVHATDGNADVAAQIANSAARGFIKAVETYTTVKGATAPAAQLYLTGPAQAPSSPTSPNKILNIALGLILGLLVGIVVAIGRDILDNRIKDPDALAKISEAPLMGTIVEDPKTPKQPLATRAAKQGTRAENFRQLRANLQYANVDDYPRVIAVTSSVAGEGKTTVALNLAATLAETGFSVCLVDADLRRPNVAKSLGLADAVGLTSVLIHQMDITEALQDAGKNLRVLAAGPTPPNPSEVLASAYVREVIRSLLTSVDYVVIDTAPLLPVADGAEVAALADGTLLVARFRTTTDANVRRSVQALGRVDARLLGTVFNRLPSRRTARDYGYEYYSADPPRSGAHSDSDRDASPATSRERSRA